MSEPNELFLNLGSDLYIKPGESVELFPASNRGDLSYEWSTVEGLSCLNCQTVIASPFETTIYTLLVIDPTGCIAEDEIIIYVDTTRYVYIPNAFSPNNDGANDLFFIHAGNDVEQIVILKIYNYWEMLVYKMEHTNPNDHSFGWNGKFEGENLTNSAYTYYAEILFIDGKVEVFTGTVLLLR